MNAAEEEVSCADLLKVLADETRLAVVRELIAGPKHVGEINETVQCEKTLLSHHLRVLRKAGIVEAERDGKAMLYRLSPAVEMRKRGPAIDLGCCQIVFEK